jgi:TRAP transporter TAXI family solute receptor
MRNINIRGGWSMNKRILLVLLALALIVSMMAFAACGGEEEEVVTEEWQWPERLHIATRSVTSPGYGAGIAWMTPLSEDTGMKVRLIAEEDQYVMSQWTKDGKIFASAPFQDRSMLYAQKGYAKRDGGPWQSRIWYPIGRSYNSFATLGDSGIKTPYDIKPGMKILYIPSPGGKLFMKALLAWAQIDEKDIVWVPASSGVNLGRNLLDGNGVVTLAWPTSSYWYEIEASPHGLAWVELDAEADPEGAERFNKFYPWVGYGVNDAGTPTSIGVPMNSSIAPYISRDGSDPELVYRLVKWLDENYNRYKDAHPWCVHMTIDNLVQLASTQYEPLHDGAIKYLEEQELWTEELEARNQFNIVELTKWVDAYQEAINMADDQGLAVDPQSDEWQEFWENYRDSLNLPLLMMFQGPGKEQMKYSDFSWE